MGRLRTTLTVFLLLAGVILVCARSRYQRNPESAVADRLRRLQSFSPNQKPTLRQNGPAASDIENDITYDPANGNDVQFLLSVLFGGRPKPIPIGEKAELLRIGFNTSRPVVMICHGYVSSSSSIFGSGQDLVSVYSLTHNVILVDWSALTGIFGKVSEETRGIFSLPYVSSARDTYKAGSEVARLIVFLHYRLGMDLSQIHLIGHSLGAHVMGAAGEIVHSRIGGKVGRITGLDPAGPCFTDPKPYCLGKAFRFLTYKDANFVDIIHTNGRNFGTLSRLGHADFYPNGGYIQPRFNETHILPIFEDMYSHLDAIDLMRRASDDIREAKKFTAKKCEGSEYEYDEYVDAKCDSTETAIMGEFCSPKARGIFYLETKPEY